MRLLKHAWETADLDSDGVLTELELRKTGPAAPGGGAVLARQIKRV
jgi:hypothetical protein